LPPRGEGKNAPQQNTGADFLMGNNFGRKNQTMSLYGGCVRLALAAIAPLE